MKIKEQPAASTRNTLVPIRQYIDIKKMFEVFKKKIIC